jgi:DnaJ-class molecular chaperone
MLHCSYRRLALKYHTEINKEESAKGEFERVCEAYDVLSHRESC